MTNFEDLPIIEDAQGTDTFDALPLIGVEQDEFDKLPLIEEDSFDQLPTIDEPEVADPEPDEPDWLDNWLIDGQRRLNDMKINMEENPIQIISDIGNSSPLEHLKAMSPEMGKLITDMEQGIEIPQELQHQPYEGKSEEEILQAAKLDRGAIELAKIHAKMQIGGLVSGKLVQGLSKTEMTRKFFANPLVHKTLEKMYSIPVVSSIIQNAANGSIGYTSFTATTGLYDMATKQITPEEYWDEVKQAPVTGAKFGAVIGAATGFAGAVEAHKAAKEMERFKQLNIKDPLQPLKLSYEKTKAVFETPSLVKNGESLKHQIWLRQLSEKPIGMKEARKLNKLLVGKHKLNLTNEEAAMANRKIESLVTYDEFSPAQLYSKKGMAKLAQSIKKISKTLKNPNVDRIEGYFITPGHATHAQYGTSEVVRFTNAQKVKTVDETSQMVKFYDKLKIKIKPQNYKASMEKIRMALEPQAFKLNAKQHKQAIKSLDKVEQEIFTQIKTRLKSYEAGVAAKGEKVIKNYFSHFRDKQIKHIETATKANRFVDPDEVKAITGIRSMHEKARKMTGGEYNVDVLDVMQRYESNMIMSRNNNAIVKLTDKFKKTHDMTTYNRKWLDKNTQENIFGRTKDQQKRTLDWAVRGETRPEIVKKFWKKLGLEKIAKKLDVEGKSPVQAYGNVLARYMSQKALGMFNVPHFIRNMTTQRMYANAMTTNMAGIEADKFLMTHKYEAAKILSKSRMHQNYLKLAGGEAAMGMDEKAYKIATESHVVRRAGLGLKRLPGQGLKLLSDIGYSPLKKGAVWNADKAVIQGYLHARSKGMGELASIVAGDGVSEVSQYLYTYSDKIPAFRGDGGKIFGLFGSWTPRHFQFIKNVVGNRGWNRWIGNAMLTTAIAEAEGIIDPYYRSGGIFKQYTDVPVFREGIEVPFDLIGGALKAIFEHDDTDWNSAKGKAMQMLTPHKIAGIRIH